MRRRLGALAGAQFGRAGARVAGDLGRVGNDGTLGEDAEARRGLHALRRMTRAGAALAARRQERFDDAVLERMKRHRHQPAAGAQDALCGRQRARELAELVVDEDAQRLEGARRRMDVAGARTHRRGDDVGEPAGRRDRGFAARLDDGAGDRARMTLLAEQEDDVGEIALARRRNDVGGALARCAHAHVERAVEAEREAALRGVELHRRDAEIEHDAVDAGCLRDPFEVAEAILGERQAVIGERAAERDGVRIAVDGDDLAIRLREDGAAVAAGAKRGVDIDAAVPDLEEFNGGAAEHGNVGGWSASDSRAAAARRHSRAPGAATCALRAAAWELSSVLSSRTFWVASASSLRNRPGSQI